MVEFFGAANTDLLDLDKGEVGAVAIIHPSSVPPSPLTRVVDANAIAQAPAALTMIMSPVMKS